MIIVDLNQVMIANLHVQMSRMGNLNLDENMFRHMVLNSIKGYLKKFKNKYGYDLVIASDGPNNWRKEVFPYYKHSRKKSRDASNIDWDVVFKGFEKIRNELKEFFPYRVIHVDGAEADDIIGVICHEHGADFDFAGMNEKILIISGDGDFKQLQMYDNVDQYDPIRDRWLKVNDPAKFLREHVIRGDAGDGVPNILSPDDVFVLSEKRQKSIYKTKLDEWLKADSIDDFCDAQMKKNHERNKKMIDLSSTPDHIKEEVMRQFNEQTDKGREKMFNYFIKYKLKNLIGDIGDF